MRGYDITAGIPAFMVHMVRSEDSEKGSDAGDGGEQAAMWDDFEYTASNGPLGATGARTTKSSTSVMRFWTTSRAVTTKMTPSPSATAAKRSSSVPTVTST